MLQARASEAEGNAIQVKVELQADCYAGVWAANAKTPKGQSVMEPGDFEEGMRAAEAIGDDTLQKETQGRVVPDSFTHGTSAQRMEALQRGFKSGDPRASSTSSHGADRQPRLRSLATSILPGVRAARTGRGRRRACSPARRRRSRAI